MAQVKDEKKANVTKRRKMLRKLCGLWPLVVFLAGLGLAYYFVSQDFDRLALIVLIAVTLVFAFFTYLQAEASRKTVKEIQKSRFASFQPIIVMGRDVTAGEMRNERKVSEQTIIEDRTRLYNVGPGPALNLSFFLKEPNRKKPITIFRGSRLSALTSGEYYELMLVNIEGWKRKGLHDLVVEYEDIFGKKWCSGLELDYDAHLDKFAIRGFFYEKLELTKQGDV